MISSQAVERDLPLSGSTSRRAANRAHQEGGGQRDDAHPGGSAQAGDPHSGRRRREVLLDRFAGVFPHRAEPDTLLLDRDRLRDCLSRLAERERSVLVLTFYAEQPSAEIATRLGTSPDNVRTVRHRAFGRLRECVRGGDA